MSWRDYCEPGPWDDDEQDEASVVCKYCGRDELFWVEIEEGKWRLVDADGDVHSCARPKPSAAEDFGPLPKQAPKPWKYSERTGKLICNCGRGYGSPRDGFCSNCRKKKK